MVDKLTEYIRIFEENDFADVVLVAAPSFLGDLRNALDDTTAAQISSSVAKDFASVSDHELRKRLAELLASS